jgi:predicted dehydrogenase
MTSQLNRRQFLEATAATGLGLGAGGYLARAAGANERIVLAVMGTNGRGIDLAKGFSRQPGTQVAFICDVDSRAIAKGIKAANGSQREEPAGVGDFRKILDDKSVDALVIAAPDHWHAPATILACSAGKHVYVEKPCCHNPREGDWMIQAARKNNRVVQMGNQRRSFEKFIEGMQQIREGAIGRAYYARCGYNNSRKSIGTGKKAQIPTWLNFDLWQGPAPRRDFHDNLVHYNWHWFWHWGTGELGNNGIHSIDVCRWGLGVTFPTRVTSSGGRYHFQDDQQTPDTHIVSFEFEDRKAIMWECRSCNAYKMDAISFHGDQGSLVMNEGGYTLFDLKGKEVKKITGPGSEASHFQNFLDCIRSGRRPNADIEDGFQSTLLCHLGNIAHRTGRTLKCDPKTGYILDDKDAMALWGRDYEKGWEPRV